MVFPGFLGNDSVKAALCAAFSAGRFPHAIILQGEPGTGKRSMAELIAMSLVCRETLERNRPCGICPSCIRARAKSHPDIREIVGSGATGAISVEAIKDLTRDAQRMPEESQYNVYILHMGERTMPAAQNKLLKLIEEPPGAAVFIILCPSAEAVLPTIRSRAQIFTLRPPEEAQAAEWLCSQAGASVAKAEELAQLCGGNLGRMQAELKGGEEARAMAIAKAMAGALLLSGGHELLKVSAPVQKDRKLFHQVLERLYDIFRDACVLRAGGKKLLSGAPDAVDALCILPMQRLIRLPDIVVEYRQKLDRNANSSLLLTCLCAQLRE